VDGHWFCFLILMIFLEDFVVVIKCYNETKILSFFFLKSNEVYCLWNFLLCEINGFSNQGLGLFFCPTYYALMRFNMGSYNSSYRQCFNLYLHITTSIVSIFY
jgi:hypothetical protein